MTRILMVVSTMNNGGAQKIFSNMMMEFPADWQIDIMLNDTGNIVYPYRGNLIDLQLKPQLDKTKIWYQIKVFFRRLYMLKKYKKENNYTACISALTSANVANVLTGKKYCKTILTIHNFMSNDVSTGITKWIMSFSMKLFYNKADELAIVSESARRDLIQNFGVKEEKVKTIYNGYCVNDIKKLCKDELDEKERKWFSEGTNTIITVGRLTKQKGQWHLVRAMKKVCDVLPNTKLIILGEGELEDYIKSLIQEYHLEHNIILGGFVGNPYKIMSKCDCFVLPSLYEGLPNALVEALICSLPCVSADFDSGAREILAPDTPIENKITNEYSKEEYGILCPVCDGVQRNESQSLIEEEEVLADAIIELLQDNELRNMYRLKAKERAKKFDMKVIIKEWERLIEG